MLLLVVVSGSATTATFAASEATTRTAFRIYDPSGKTKVVVTITDVVRSSIRANRDPGGGGTLAIPLTPRGRAKFHRLTLALAQRGARLHRSQRLAMKIGGSVRKALIDYQAEPEGIPASTPLLITGLRFSTAQRFARLLRAG